MVIADEFYTALQAPNCKLITWPIARCSARGIRTAEGIEHHCDVIIFASAPDDAGASQIPVTGDGGQPLPESDEISVAGFPICSWRTRLLGSPAETRYSEYVAACTGWPRGYKERCGPKPASGCYRRRG